jgi:uncharacterized repeat protein (TIGR03803 family)
MKLFCLATWAMAMTATELTAQTFTTVFSFPETNGPGYKNHYGAYPCDRLIMSGKTLYGTAANGGPYGTGTVFKVNILLGNALYSAASGGGLYGTGTVFSITLPVPPLNITASDANVILTWPTKYAGFDYTGYTLLSTKNLASPAVWATNSSSPVVVNGQFTVTNPITGTQQFYRLSQ